MISSARTDVYSVEEIARAAGAPEEHVVAALGNANGADAFVPFAEALRIGCALSRPDGAVTLSASIPLFSLLASIERRGRATPVPFVLSSTLHVTTVVVAVLVATLGLTPTAATLPRDAAEPTRLIFLATPGPGGGGGGGGLLQEAAPPMALREGVQKTSSPLPVRRPAKPIVPAATPPEPKAAPLEAEPLPAVAVAALTVPADNRSRVGVLEQSTADNDSHGSGRGGGVGAGSGTGIGAGDGTGVGAGSGGGTGGGPYRPGSGIDPPRLLREVKAEYPEEARQRGVGGDVVLEIVVRRDGSVGEIRVLQGLGSGLNDRAVQAVRQWRFAPAQRLGTAVDVIVEVAVEFKLR